MSTLIAAGVTPDELKAALLDVFVRKTQFEALVRAARGVQSLDIVALGDALDEIAEKVINRAESESWLPALIETAWTMQPNHPGLTRIRQAWQVPAVAIPADHAKALLLPGKTVLINRQILREKLQTLQAANGSRVLVVDGDSVSGKTYTLHYVSYLASAGRTFRHSYVDLERMPRTADNTIDAAKLAGAIAIRLVGEPVPPPKDGNQLTWLDHFEVWLEQKLPKQQIHWLVIDNFRKVALEQSALELVADLAMRTYQTLDNLRLVLLSYGDREALQAQVVGCVEYEPIAAIGTKDVAGFFSQLYVLETLRRKEVPDPVVLAERVRESVRRVLENIPENGVRRLEALCRTAWIEADQILRPPAAPADPTELLIAAVTVLAQRGLEVAEQERD
jgi:hypothetical protein